MSGLKGLGASKQDDRSALDVEPQQVVPAGPSLLIGGLDLTLPAPCRRPARSAQLRWIWEDSIPRIKASLVAITITDPSTIVPCAQSIQCWTLRDAIPLCVAMRSKCFLRAPIPNNTIVLGANEAPFDIAQDRVSHDWSSAGHPRAPCRGVQAALEHVLGSQKQIEAVTVGAEDDDSDLRRSDIIEAVNRVDSGDGVAILTDMFGGMPSNLAISCMSRPKVDVLAGINLPMLVKLAKVREDRSLLESNRRE